MTAILKMTRDARGIELRRGLFDIQVDGRSVGSITRHQTVETPLEAGHHMVQIRKGRYSSQGHPFEAVDGEVVNFQTHGAMVWPRYVASIVKPDLAIALKRK